MARKTIKGVPILDLQAGTPRTVFATWGATKFSHQSGYQVLWEYITDNNVWFVGSDSNVTGTIATYSAPNNARRVRCSVKPNPGNKATWKSSYHTSAEFSSFMDETDYTPTVPSNVEISIAGNILTAKVLNYSHEYSSGWLQIQVVADDSRVVADAAAANALGVAQIQFVINKFVGTRYKARALAYSSHGAGYNSAWSSYSANVYEPPGKAVIKNLKTISDDSVDISWDPLQGAKSYTLQYTATVVDDVPVFDTGSSDVQEASGITATHYLASSLEMGKRWYFRLRGENDAQLPGDWSEIQSVMVGTKPDIPTVWSYTTVGKIGVPIVLNWIHSSKDGSDQTGAHLCIKINDGEESIIDLTTESTYTYQTGSLSDGDKIQWRVQTRGTQGLPPDKEWGDYSEYREIIVYAPPTLTFTVGVVDEEELHPVVESFPIRIQGASGPATQTPVAFYISITSDDSYDISEEDGTEVHVIPGQEIYSSYIQTETHILNHTISPGEIFLNRGSTYTVTVTVAMTNGLTAEASNKFIAKWDEPTWDPDADVVIDKNSLVAYIRPYCADEWEFEFRRGFTLAVYRRDFDGQLTEIASNIDAGGNTTITDLHPSLDYARYRIVATDLRTGKVYYNDIAAVPVNAKMAVIQWEGEAKSFFADPDALEDIVNDWSGTILRLPYNIDVSDDISPDVSLVEYIGRKHPVSYYGTQQGSTSRWTVTVPKSDIETISRIRALAIYPGDVYVREPSGTGYWANVKVSYSTTHNNPAVSAQFTIARVEGGA